MKALIQQHPELRCESYGFGAERRLHIFKSGCTSQMQMEVPDSPKLDKVHNFPVQLPVRNTFIHIEDAPADERAVQSMPPGMFRQCVLAESSRKPLDKVAKEELDVDASPMLASEPEAEPVACPSDAEEHCGKRMPFGIGALVVVEGLSKLPAFNGLSAVVQGWDEATGRYSILLVSSEGGCQQAKVKEENLRLLLPCP